eukprot:gene14018-20125_t
MPEPSTLYATLPGAWIRLLALRSPPPPCPPNPKARRTDLEGAQRESLTRAEFQDGSLRWELAAYGSSSDDAARALDGAAEALRNLLL